MARRYSVFVFIVKGERQHFRLLLPPLSAHIAGAGALVIRRAAARSFYRWQRVFGSACVHTNVTSDFVGKSCVYAIDMVKLSCGWFNPSDIYKIGGSVMFRFCRKQFGLWRTRFWCSPQLWRATQNHSHGRISQTVDCRLMRFFMWICIGGCLWISKKRKLL